MAILISFRTLLYVAGFAKRKSCYLCDAGSAFPQMRSSRVRQRIIEFSPSSIMSPFPCFSLRAFFFSDPLQNFGLGCQFFLKGSHLSKTQRREPLHPCHQVTATLFMDHKFRIQAVKSREILQPLPSWATQTALWWPCKEACMSGQIRDQPTHCHYP